MVWMIATDTETLDLLDAAAEMASAALAARSKRVDEDGILKRSVDMSRMKLETLRKAFHQSPIVTWEELTEGQKLEFIALCENVLKLEGENERSALYKVIRAFVLRPGTKEPFSGGAKPWSYDDLPGSEVGCYSEVPESERETVRRVRRKNRQGSSSQETLE